MILTQFIHKIKTIYQFFDSSFRIKTFKMFFLTTIVAMLEIAGIGILFPLIKIISLDDKMFQNNIVLVMIDLFGFNSKIEIIVLLCLLVVTVYTIKNLGIASIYLYQTNYIFGLNNFLSKKVFENYLFQPYSFHTSQNSGNLVENIIIEVNNLIFHIISPIITIISESTIIIMAFILLIIIQPLGTIVIIIIVGSLLGIFNYLVKNRIANWGESRKVYDSRRIKHLNHALIGIKDVKVFNGEDFFLRLYSNDHQNKIDSERKIHFTRDVTKLWLEFALVLAISILIFTVYLFDEGVSSIIPTLALFAAVSFRVLPSLNKISNGIQSIRYSIPVLDLMIEELGRKVCGKYLEKNISISFKREILVDKVSFSYPNSHDKILNEVSLEIKRGETIGFVGSSGSGKSTLIDVILGILKPSSGNILIDNVIIDFDTLENRRMLFGYVPQSVFLLDDTIEKNIAFCLDGSEINRDLVLEAVEKAQLSELILSLPLGLKTTVGERGVKLSGGQLQRIGIARALYHKPEILILDESTASLDVATEKSVMNAITSLYGKITILIIAHRITTLSNCSRIYNLQNGKLTEMNKEAL